VIILSLYKLAVDLGKIFSLSNDTGVYISTVMRHLYLCTLLFIGLPSLATAMSSSLKPPVAKKESHDTMLHGIVRHDDYFWLRQKNTPDVLSYLDAENRYTDAMMKPTEGLQNSLFKELLSHEQEADVTAPYRYQGDYYYSRTEPGKPYEIHCRKQGSPQAPEQVLLDLNELGKNEKFIALADVSDAEWKKFESQPRLYRVSDDGNILAYALDKTGFRVYTLFFKNLRTHEILPDKMNAVDGMVWAKDNKTIFYVTEDNTKRANQVHRHVLGSDPKDDTLIYEEKDERFSINLDRTRDEQFILMTIASHTTSEVRYLSTSTPLGEFKTIASRMQGQEYYVDHRGDNFYIRTNDLGRNFRVVSTPINDSRRSHWRELVSVREDVTIENIDVFKDFYVLLERKGGLEHLRVVKFKDNTSDDIAFSEPAYSLTLDDNETFDTHHYRYQLSSFITPQSVFDYDVNAKAKTLLKQQVVPHYDPSLYVEERVFAPAPDATQIPISIVYKKGIKKDGTAPLLLYGYGAYRLSRPVEFDANRLPLLDRGIVYARAHIRGGGEFGNPWYDQGRMQNKKNTFTDFIASAEYLIQQKYTSSSHLAIEGRSAGGLLMGAVANMRPDLFKVVIAGMPFVDVINTMLDETLPLTVGEFEEWGNPKIKEQYNWMAAYSPYDNVAAHSYPVMLVESSYNDSQVMYFEPAKWVAKLRATKSDKNLLLLKMNMKPASHAGNSGRYDRLHDIAFRYAFLFSNLGMKS